jgi:hypothetical protein
MNKKSRFIAALGALAFGAYAAQAVPATITGGISFFFGGGTASSAAGTTTISFDNNQTVVGGTGDYLGVPFGTPATFTSVSYTGTGAGAKLTGPILPEWTLTLADGTTYSFDLLSLDNGDTGIGQFSASTVISGTGVAHITGKTPTTANWNLIGFGGGDGALFFFLNATSASGTASGIAAPDGGLTAILLGLGFLGVAGLRRKLS